MYIIHIHMYIYTYIQSRSLAAAVSCIFDLARSCKYVSYRFFSLYHHDPWCRSPSTSSWDPLIQYSKQSQPTPGRTHQEVTKKSPRSHQEVTKTPWLQNPGVKSPAPAAQLLQLYSASTQRSDPHLGKQCWVNWVNCWAFTPQSIHVGLQAYMSHWYSGPFQQVTCGNMW